MQIKKGNRCFLKETTLNKIKKIVFYGVRKHNIDLQLYNYVLNRMYGKSKWILDEDGKKIMKLEQYGMNLKMKKNILMF